MCLPKKHRYYSTGFHQLRAVISECPEFIGYASRNPRRRSVSGHIFVIVNIVSYAYNNVKVHDHVVREVNWFSVKNGSIHERRERGERWNGIDQRL
ncbi:hypothetical protein X801_07967, partial [Opisthorchis viverrini]